MPHCWLLDTIPSGMDFIIFYSFSNYICRHLRSLDFILDSLIIPVVQPAIRSIRLFIFSFPFFSFPVTAQSQKRLVVKFILQWIASHDFSAISPLTLSSVTHIQTSESLVISASTIYPRFIHFTASSMLSPLSQQLSSPSLPVCYLTFLAFYNPFSTKQCALTYNSIHSMPQLEIL